MSSTIDKFPVVKQYTMTGTAALLTGVPAKVVAADVTCDQAWTFGESEAQCLFPVAANVVKQIPVARIREGYFNAASGTLTVAFYIEN